MTVTTRAGLITAAKAGQDIEWHKSASRTTVATGWFSMTELAGQPGPGVLAGTSTTVGVVPTSATAGMPTINSFNGVAGCVYKIEHNNVTAGQRASLYDLLFKSGAHNFNAADTLGSQPSYSSRVPSGTDYAGLEIWVEIVTAFTGNPDFTITYTKEDGTTGRTCPTLSPGLAPTLGRMFQIPLQAGDSGVQKIESVTCATATVGTFNVLVMRPLMKNLRLDYSVTKLFGVDITGLPQVWDTSAFFPIISSDSTSTSTPDITISIAVG